ncbi:MAG TPA: hypothetical protein ENJ45_02580, partial [Phaeodactylibacter sp.]|nr:hypothetical protein [Phaeodactylibacter sp.]
MDENIYISLIYKRFDGTLSPEEEKRLHDWLAASEEHRLEAKAVEQALLLGAKYSSEVDVDLDADFELLQKRIASDAPDTQRIARDATAQVVPELKMDTKPSGKIRPLFKAWQVAASVALLLLAGFLVKQYLGESPQWQEQFASTKQDKAILLADGTKVWLNAGTTFRYPKSFDGNTRSVQLSGEAFFQVAKDATKPFIIKSTSGTVQVLGTSFNVRDFDKEELMSVDVVEGKV